jgi:predicted 2-oxoglutarate/Fe(II)-dependent dioxygenase YbiX
MPSPDFFARLGLFVQPHFLDSAFCQQVVSELHSAPKTNSAVVRETVAAATPGTVSTLVDERSRKTQQVCASAAIVRQIQQQLQAIQPTIGAHFNLALTGLEQPLFYAYETGSFFGAHRDCNRAADVPQFIQDRRVSTIIFLNSAESYAGGALTFYGLIDDWQDYGFPLMGETGMLVAFRSDILHEVKLITAGERYTIANWFASAQEEMP